MRPLLVLSLLASVLLLSACGGTHTDRLQLSAKGWDTPFVRIKPIREVDPNAAGANPAASRLALSQAAYGQFPVSIDPTALAAEMEAVPGMPPEAAAPGGTAESGRPDHAAAPASAPAVGTEVHAPARAATQPALDAGTVVVAASAAPPPAEAAITQWYESRHVDLMPRSDWVR